MKQPLLFAAMVAAGSLFAASNAHATDWVDRPLTLGLLGVHIDGALGFSQAGDLSGGSTWATGATVEGAVGLPLGLEVGLRLGFPFGDTARAAVADQFGRLYDPIGMYESRVGGAGPSDFANPEVRVQKSLVDVGFAAAAIDLRAVLPVDHDTDFVITPGGRVRFRIPHVLRVDAAVYVPIGFTSPGPNYGVDVPVAIWFDIPHILYIGPETGVFYTHNAGASIALPTLGTLTADSNQTDIHLGLGFGHTFGGMFDVKGELLTTRINDSNWNHYVGIGAGVGLHFD